MKRFLCLILHILAASIPVDAQGLPTPVALTVSVNTSGVLSAPSNFWSANSNAIKAVAGVGGGTTYLFDSNSFAVSSTNITLGSTLYLTNDMRVFGRTNTYGFSFVDVVSFEADARNLTLTGIENAYLDGGETTIRGVTNLNIRTPAVTAFTATVGQVLTLTDAGEGRVEFTSVGSESLNLRAWAASTAFTLTGATRDVDDLVTTSTVSWPDGSGGTFTLLVKDSTHLAINSFSVTHTDSGKTITQPTVTRNTSGAVTAQPALVVTP